MPSTQSVDVERFDMLAVAEHFEEMRTVERGKRVCGVCDTPFKGDAFRHRRTIRAVTGPDTWDTYACPGCRPDEYIVDARRVGDSEQTIRRLLARAARDVAAGRRL